jgi:transposase
MTDSEILRTYINLTSIESVFRCLKSELGLRPVYHKVDRRVESHMFISLLAYQVVNYIRRCLKKNGITDSWTTIRETAAEQKEVISIMKANSCNKGILRKRLTCLTEKILEYYEAMYIDKRALKAIYRYTSIEVWEFYKALSC